MSVLHVMSEHIVPLKVYVTIFLALMVGTALTVWAGLHDFPGNLNVIIALTIAVVKATLVVLYFMHVRYSSRLIWVVFTSALFWLAILFVFTLSDYWTRDWLPIRAPFV
ncbi:MAG TPA: cytochrome C oxidase subunit IV family protein [Pyrinomonadaceae bacterium]|nr:cytochrome C oxidase subunit IV family protein [Pyrinomonadaceae bacterium]